MEETNKEIFIQNKYGIKRTHWESTPYWTYCPLGLDWCNNKLEVDVVFSETIFDHYLLKDWVMEHINGKEYSTEESAYRLYRFLNEGLKPYALTVRNTQLGKSVWVEI